MPEGSFLVLECDRRTFALPSATLESLRSWEAPHPLPLAAPWLAGLLEGEGEVIPVLRAPWLGAESEGPHEVLALLLFDGFRLAVPGSSPRLCVPDASEPSSEETAGPWSETLSIGPLRVPCLDAEKLYLELGLH